MKPVVECDRHKYKQCLYYVNKDSSGQVIFSFVLVSPSWWQWVHVCLHFTLVSSVLSLQFFEVDELLLQ